MPTMYNDTTGKGNYNQVSTAGQRKMMSTLRSDLNSKRTYLTSTSISFIFLFCSYIDIISPRSDGLKNMLAYNASFTAKKYNYTK